MTDVLLKRGYLGTEMTHIEDDVKTLGEQAHLQAKQRNLEQIFPSHPSEGTNPDDASVLKFWHLNLWEKFLFKQPRAWYFVMVSLANQYKSQMLQGSTKAFGACLHRAFQLSVVRQ